MKRRKKLYNLYVNKCQVLKTFYLASNIFIMTVPDRGYSRKWFACALD